MTECCSNPEPKSQTPSPCCSARSDASNDALGWFANTIPNALAYAEAVRELEVALLQRALENSRHNQKKAAEYLGMTYHQFRWLYQKYKDEVGES